MKNPPNNAEQGSLMVRILAGGYLIYLAWEMRESFADGILYILPAAAFVVIGAALVFFSVRSLIRLEMAKQQPPKETEVLEDGEEDLEENETEDEAKEETFDV